MRALLTLLLLLPPPVQALEALILRLTLVHFPSGLWQEREITEAAAQATAILGQCGILPGGIEIVRADVEARFRAFHTPTSRELARRLQPKTPAIYFVDLTRQQPAFEAEAIGRGNSRRRPELQDTVWVVHGARDLPVALAHELSHVLMDSGEHVQIEGNLMREETLPGSIQLTAAQCSTMRSKGAANGLLQPSDKK